MQRRRRKRGNQQGPNGTAFSRDLIPVAFAFDVDGEAT